MDFFVWKKEYAGGIGSIDEQHKVIIDLMNKLFDAIKFNTAYIVIKDVLAELLYYTNYHFTLEAELFKVFEYSEKDEHIRQHNIFVDELKKMISDYNTNTIIPINVLYFLRDWFENHI